MNAAATCFYEICSKQLLDKKIVNYIDERHQQFQSEKATSIFVLAYIHKEFTYFN